MKKLRVAHYPQIPCRAFVVEVEDEKEAYKLMTTLAEYDSFQYENKIKPDYCNSSVLEQFNEDTQKWEAWIDEETGIDDLREFLGE